MRTTRTISILLAGGLAVAALSAGPPPASAAESEPFAGDYRASAAADGVRVAVTLPAAPLSNTVADVGGPTASAQLDSIGGSQAFASFPYPGANLAVAGGLVKGASGGQVPAPDYPFYVVSYNPTVPEQEVGSGPYVIRAESTATSSAANASAGLKVPGLGTVGHAESTAAATSATAAVVGTASSHVTGFAVGPLNLGQVISDARTELGADGRLTRSADTRVVGAKVGQTPVVFDAAGVSVGESPAPMPDTTAVNELLAKAGISVKFSAQEQPETGVVAPVVRITQTEPQSGATVTYTIGGAAAFVDGTAAAAAVKAAAPVETTSAAPAPAPASVPAVASPAAAAGPASLPAPPASFAAAAPSPAFSTTTVPVAVGTLTLPDASSLSGAGSLEEVAAAPTPRAAAAPTLLAQPDRRLIANRVLLGEGDASPMLGALLALLVLIAGGAAVAARLLSKEARV